MPHRSDYPTPESANCDACTPGVDATQAPSGAIRAHHSGHRVAIETRRVSLKSPLSHAIVAAGSSCDTGMNAFARLRGDGPIVLVDDDYADGWLLRRCYKLSALSNELIWLGSGLALVEYLRAVVGGTVAVPALIMLDLRMPGLDGLHTLKLIDSIPGKPALDIVVFTNSRSPYYLEQASRLGATAYLTKAEDPAETIEIFNSLAA